MRRYLAVLICGFVFSVPVYASNWDSYQSLLTRYVAPVTIHGVDLNGVDYAALRNDPEFQRALDTLAAADLSLLKTDQQQLAFYINAYNLLAIAVVAKHWPVNSIKDTGSLFWPVWKREAGVIAGKAVTLDEVEHEIIRSLGEPRIHFAIVCASVSCPDLRPEIYRAESLSSQLDDQAQAFLNNSQKGLLVTGNEFKVSKIFSWFSEDFDDDVKAFVLRYRPELADKNIHGFLPYDWGLNLVSTEQ